MSVRDESKVYDVRIIERNFRKGLLSRKEYERHLSNLHDCADKVVVSQPSAQNEGFDAGPDVLDEEDDELDDDTDEV